jgi:uncharacterized protein YkwD
LEITATNRRDDVDGPGSAPTLGLKTLSPRQLALVFAALVLAAAIPIAVPRFVPDLFPTATGDNQCYTYKADEKAFVAKMNAVRANAGKGKLRLDPELSKASAVHTKEMVKAQLLHHTSTTALKRRVTGWNSLGENVGAGGSVDSLHAAFMGSPAHKANIMHPGFNNVGTGVTVDSAGRMWVTVIFESKANPGTPLKMPTC